MPAALRVSRDPPRRERRIPLSNAFRSVQREFSGGSSASRVAANAPTSRIEGSQPVKPEAAGGAGVAEAISHCRACAAFPRGEPLE
jgi:hypothetical protein